MKTASVSTKRAGIACTERSDALFAAAFGLWIGLALLKFGNPAIPALADAILPPADIYEFLINSWPLSWGYILMLGLIPMAFLRWHWSREAPLWIVLLPGAWLVFQIIATLHSVDSTVSSRVLLHFASVTSAFYLGFGCFSTLRDVRWFWLLLFISFSIVLIDGFYQHFIGLEETRQYFELHFREKYPGGVPPELLQKLGSNRIYSTLFYPNTLAAVLLLCTPAAIGQIWLAEGTRAVRVVLAGGILLASLLCLLWSGSKAGWLIAVMMAGIALTRLIRSRRQKRIAIAAVSIAGLLFFAWRYAQYFERGATSAGARVDYWRVAVRAFAEQPLAGHGPGTFMHSYKRLKPAGAEMTKLAHNDYLQQASDSGLPGFLTFFVFVWGSVYLLYRKSYEKTFEFAVWLGLFGVSVDAMFEFNLYVPAIAWMQFLFFGWLWGRSTEEIK